MKLSEIHIIPIIEVSIGPDQPIGLNDPTLLKQLRPLNTDIEGYPLSALQIGDQLIFAISDSDEQLLSTLIGRIITDFPGELPRKTIKMERSWTPPAHRNKGFATALYDGLTRQGYRVVSDLQISQSAASVWKKLGQQRQLKAFNWDTKQYTDADPFSNPNVSFVMEHFGYGHSRSSILLDHVTFTIMEDCP